MYYNKYLQYNTNFFKSHSQDFDVFEKLTKYVTRLKRTGLKKYEKKKQKVS